jgi:hypothetical protein
VLLRPNSLMKQVPGPPSFTFLRTDYASWRTTTGTSSSNTRDTNHETWTHYYTLTAPTADGGSPNTGYYFRYCYAMYVAPALFIPSTATGFSIITTNPDPPTQTSLTAINLVGESDYHANLTNAPGPVIHPQAVNVSARFSDATTKWWQLSYAYGYPCTGFDIYDYTTGRFVQTVWAVTTNPALHEGWFTVPLADRTLYRFRARNEWGIGPMSAVDHTLLNRTAPDAPSIAFIRTDFIEGTKWTSSYYVNYVAVTPPAVWGAPIEECVLEIMFNGVVLGNYWPRWGTPGQQATEVRQLSVVGYAGSITVRSLSYYNGYLYGGVSNAINV